MCVPCWHPSGALIYINERSYCLRGSLVNTPRKFWRWLSRVDTMLPPLAACRRALVVAAAAVLTSPRSLRAAADVDSTAGLRLDGAALQRARQQQL